MPLAARRDDLLAAIRDHQIVIVAGETGSGKSTQLPKLCLELGRGVNGLIGHTQPRRVAARTIAERIAEELGTQLGDTVGYTVRFTDTVGERTLVKVMTDGILLAEIQRDRMLRRYDTLIIDEAHERSLNTDFLLGYLAQLLPRRPDLKLIVTSATIDTQRFSEHFADAAGNAAPVIEVTGRAYPVELRYRPLQPDSDQVQAVVDALDELEHEGDGDVLVFLSGEREIHDTADALRRHFGARIGHGARSTNVLPLYARLSAVEQHRIWQTHNERRVVLSTNIAETSLTVPGVRYVIDAGSVRMSRYSHRLKVQRLPIEPVSQASANQRAGRCGRVAPGICIRLYDEEDFAERPEFSEPEILRTNLASVILQMTALGLGDVAAFPFLDAPDSRSVRDGFALLEELGAIEPGAEELTPIGQQLARLPIDPRLGRMVLEAARHGCVREVIIIASVLSIQDPRERPVENRDAAEEAHRRFEVAGSDFLTLVKLWDYLRERQRALSSSQFRKLCRTEYLNYLRVREWQDLFSQLRQVAGQTGVRQGTDPSGIAAGHPDRVHQALLAGLLSHLGFRDGATRDSGGREYRGAHGSKFMIGQGSVVGKLLPRWVIAAELVETNRLWGRMVAAVQPEWAESLASHLAKCSYGEPYWDAQRGAAVCIERVSLHGLPIVSGRTIGYDRVNPVEARELFIRCALTEGDWTTHHEFWSHNGGFLADLKGWGERVRRVDLIDEDSVYRFYDQRIGPEVVSTRHFDRWWKRERAQRSDLLTMRLEHFVNTPVSDDDFPTVWRHSALNLNVTYRFDPGSAIDGATVHIPIAALNQIEPEGFDWGVPGFRADLIGALLKSLPKDYRRELVPMTNVIDRVVGAIGAPESWEAGTSIAAALTTTVRDATGIDVPPHAFDADTAPPHLRITFSVDDDHGSSLATGRDLLALRKQLTQRLRVAIAREAPIEERTGITKWDLGELPREITTKRADVPVRGYPALLDDGASVSIRVFTTLELQTKVMRNGVRRLLLLATPVSKRALERDLTDASRLAVARYRSLSIEQLTDDSLTAAADRVIADFGELPFTATDFDRLVAAAHEGLADRAATALRDACDVVAAANAVNERLARLVAPAVSAGADDARQQLNRLVRHGFVTAAGVGRLADLLRYVKGIDVRLNKLPENPTRDATTLRSVLALEKRYVALLRRLDHEEITPEVIDLGWQLEELRVSLFAQQLGTARSVSIQRITKELTALDG